MHVQIVGPQTLRCGVAEYGRLLGEALAERGHQVVHIGDLPSPIGYSGTDVVILNWHGGLHGHLRKEHLPQDIPVVLYLHESRPSDNRASTPLWDDVDLLVAPEGIPLEGLDRLEVIPMPAPDYTPHAKPPEGGPLRVGTTGLRREGREVLDKICGRHGWRLIECGGGYNDRWRSTKEVVEELAQNHINAFHYGNAYGGQSLAVMMAVAARRPILVSTCRQFDSLRQYDGEGIRFYEGEVALEDILRVRAHTLHAQHLWKKPKKIWAERNWQVSGWRWEKVLESML